MLDSDFMPDADPVALAQSAAAWLSRIRYRVHGQAPVFSPAISTYHEMVDPSAPPEKRLAACRRMLEAVQRHIVVEQIRADEQPSRSGMIPTASSSVSPSAARSWR
jgi:hypothetical protein